MRRVAFDRWVAQAREETIAVTRRARTEQLQQAFAARKQARTEAPPEREMDRSRGRRAAPSPLPVSTPAEPQGQPEPAEESDNPLLAAKRRARSKMENE